MANNSGYDFSGDGGGDAFDKGIVSGMSNEEVVRLIGEFRKSQQLSSIKEVTWFVTSQCHLNCNYCYVRTDVARRASDSVLSVSEVLDCFAQCVALGADRLSLRGGEPFLRADLPVIIFNAAILGLATNVITKTAISKKNLKYLSSTENLSIGFSLDTVDANVGDSLLGKGGHTTALMRAVRQAVDYGVTTVIEATVTSETVRGLDALVKFAEQTNVRALHLREVAPHTVRPVKTLLLNDANRLLLKEIERKYSGSHLSVVATPAFSEQKCCGEGLNSIAFLPDGTATKCTASLARDPEMFYGNIRNSSVSRILNGQLLKEIIIKERGRNSELPEGLRVTGREVPCSQLVKLATDHPVLIAKA